MRPLPMRAPFVLTAAAFFALASLLACNDSSSSGSAAPAATAAAATAAPPTPPAPAEEARAPEIIVDRVNVDVGKNRTTSGRGLEDRVGVFLRGSPGIEGRTVDVVAMRAAVPSDVAAVVEALRQAKAAGAGVKTEARDATTQRLPVTFVTSLPDCATALWIGKDASLHLWPAGGGTAKRVPRGLAGPDLTLGMEAMEKLAADCEAPAFAVGADDTMTWGLVFDVAQAAQHQRWTRTSGAVLVTGAVPGRKVTLP
jgi:hypothetical protein